MAKRVKKAQHKLGGLNLGGNKIEAFMNFQTVEDFVYKYKNLYMQPWYQRDPESWSPAQKAYYITALYEGLATNPITICETENREFELTDGGHRAQTQYELITNKIKLPLTIPPEKGGGKYFKDAPEETQKRLLNAKVYVELVQGADEKQRQRIFLNLQKGEKLSTGQIISANYGQVFQTIESIHNNSRLTKYLSKTKDLEWRSINAVLMFETKHVKAMTIDKEIPFVESGYNQEVVSKQQYRNVMKIFDKLADICEAGKIHGLSTARLIYWYLFFKRNPNIMEKNASDLSEFLIQFHSNISVVSRFVKTNNMRFGLNEELYYKNYTYRNTRASEIKLYMGFMEMEYERYSKGEMIVYTEKVLLDKYGN